MVTISDISACKRLVNPPLAFATLLVLAITIWCGILDFGAQCDLRIAKEDAFNSMHALAKLEASAQGARAAESLWLLGGPAAPAARQRYSEVFFALAHEILSNPKPSGAPNGAGYSGLLGEELANITFPGEGVAANNTLAWWLKFIEVDRDIRRAQQSATRPPRSLWKSAAGRANQPGRSIQWFSITYQGVIYIPVTGSYRFRLSSDDGSQLFLDESLVIDNDGVHSMREKSAAVALKQGNHGFRLRYFQGPAAELGLQLFVKEPGDKEKIFALQDFDQKVLESRRQLHVTEDAHAIHIRLGAEVLFDSGKSDLRPAATTSLQELADGCVAAIPGASPASPTRRARWSSPASAVP